MCSSDLDDWASEARRIIELWSGHDLSQWHKVTGPADSSDAGDNETDQRPDEWRRGQPDKPESSWTALSRYAEGLGRRRFVSARRLILARDQDLLRALAHQTIPIDHPIWTEQPEIDKEGAARVNQITGKVLLSGWTTPPGGVVDLTGAGSDASGAWLVESLGIKAEDPVGEVSLIQPQTRIPTGGGNSRKRKTAEPADKLKDVKATGAYRGTQAICEQFVVPFMKKRGLAAGSTKRTPAQNQAAGGVPTSDHLTTNTSTYAIDFPTTTGAQAAKDLAATIGWTGYKTGNHDHFVVKIDGGRFRFQILWGAEIQHGDHIHVGVRAV